MNINQRPWWSLGRDNWVVPSRWLATILIGLLIVHGLGLIFLIFGAISLVAAASVFRFAVETTQRVLEELSP